MCTDDHVICKLNKQQQNKIIKSEQHYDRKNIFSILSRELKISIVCSFSKLKRERKKSRKTKGEAEGGKQKRCFKT